MTGKSGPVWLCERPRRPSIYVTAPVSTAAFDECENLGLGRPAMVHYAGYSVEAPPPAPKINLTTTTRPTPPKNSKKSTRRAELALSLYAVLRCDFPIRSILQPFDAASRLPSKSALRDFLADFGTAIERVTHDRRAVEAVIEAQANGWLAAAKEKNARDAGKWKRAELEAERKIRHRQNAKRLRKRVAYIKAIGQLAEILEGMLPAYQNAENAFRRQLVTAGLGVDDVNSLVGRLRRITVPKV